MVHSIHQKAYGSLLLVSLLLVGCSAPATQPAPSSKTNTSRVTDHAQGLKAIPALIRSGHLVRADEAYASYRNAHESTRGVPSSIVALAQAHLTAKEYLLTRFYLNEYRRGFPSGKQRAQIEYLAGEARYRQYQAGHDENLADEAHQILRGVSRTFRRSPWAAKARTLSARLREEQNKYYAQLATYYEKRGKPKAAAIYRAKIKK